MPLQASRKVLSDDEMAALEGGNAASPASTPSEGTASAPAPQATSKPARKVLSDDEMSALEASQKPQNPSDVRAAGGKSMFGKIVDVASKAAMGPFGDLLEASGGSPSVLARAGLDTATLGNLGYNKSWRNQLDEDYAANPKSAMLGHVGGAAGLAAVGNELPALTLAKNVWGGINATPALVAGAQAALSKPGDTGGALDDIKQRIANGETGLAVGAALHAGAGAAGWAGDKLMGMATGIKDAAKGMGTRIANEGLWGTRGKMIRDATGGINKAEGVLDNGVSGMSGKLSSSPSVKALMDKAAEYTPSAGQVPSSNIPFKDAAQFRALEAGSRPDMNPSEYLDYSRKLAKPAYDPNGNALDNFRSKLDQLDAATMKTTLKNAAGSQGIPAVGDALRSQETLYAAKNGMNAPINPTEYIKMLAKTAGAGAVGAGIGNHEDGGIGAAAGGLAGVLMASPVGQSIAAQMLTQGAKASPAVTSALLDNYLRTKREEAK